MYIQEQEKFEYRFLLHIHWELYRFDEMPAPAANKKRDPEKRCEQDVVITSDGTNENVTTSAVLAKEPQIELGGGGGSFDSEAAGEVEFIDSQRPGLHISTFMRQARMAHPGQKLLTLNWHLSGACSRSQIPGKDSGART